MHQAVLTCHQICLTLIRSPVPKYLSSSLSLCIGLYTDQCIPEDRLEYLLTCAKAGFDSKRKKLLWSILAQILLFLSVPCEL